MQQKINTSLKDPGFFRQVCRHGWGFRAGTMEILFRGLQYLDLGSFIWFPAGAFFSLNTWLNFACSLWVRASDRYQVEMLRVLRRLCLKLRMLQRGVVLEIWFTYIYMTSCSSVQNSRLIDDYIGTYTIIIIILYGNWHDIWGFEHWSVVDVIQWTFFIHCAKSGNFSGLQCCGALLWRASPRICSRPSEQNGKHGQNQFEAIIFGCH